MHHVPCACTMEASEEQMTVDSDSKDKITSSVGYECNQSLLHRADGSASFKQGSFQSFDIDSFGEIFDRSSLGTFFLLTSPKINNCPEIGSKIKQLLNSFSWGEFVAIKLHIFLTLCERCHTYIHTYNI